MSILTSSLEELALTRLLPREQFRISTSVPIYWFAIPKMLLTSKTSCSILFVCLGGVVLFFSFGNIKWDWEGIFLLTLFSFIHKLESGISKATSSQLRGTNVHWPLPQKVENYCRKPEIMDMEFWNILLESRIYPSYDGDSIPNRENWAALVHWSWIFSLSWPLK